MSEAKIDNIITPEMVLETGRKLRKAWLATLSPEEIKQLINRVPPEERLAGLSRDEMVILMKQIEAYLGTHATETDHPQRRASQGDEELPLTDDS